MSAVKESPTKNTRIIKAHIPALTFEQERKEIAVIAEMLTDGEKIYYLLGAARALLRIETQKRPPIT
jgi:hypothetical protein